MRNAPYMEHGNNHGNITNMFQIKMDKQKQQLWESIHE